MTALPHDIATASPAVQRRYGELIDAGNSPVFAEMLALRKSPASRTDNDLFRDVGTLDKQFEGDPAGLGQVVAAAKARGYTPSPNDFYVPGLADDIGDPKAFISQAEGRGRIRAVGEQIGVRGDLGCGINLRGRELENPIAPGALAPDLVQERVAEMVAADPGLMFKADPRELAAEAQSKHGFSDASLVGASAFPAVVNPTGGA